MTNASGAPAVLAAIGCEKRDIGEYLSLLTGAGVDVLMDVRQRASYRGNADYNKGRLSLHLQGAGIEYVHEKELGNPYRDEAWDEQRSLYLKALDGPAREAFLRVLNTARARRIALFCIKSDIERCHRGWIIDKAEAEHQPVVVIKL